MLTSVVKSLKTSIKMTKLLFALLLLCSPAMAVEDRWPTYCVRSVTDNGDGTVMLDMPGYPYGMNDRPIRVTQWKVDMLLESDNCTPDDPRMQ